MSTFAVTETSEIFDSVNYLLSNLNTGNAVANVTIPTGTLIANTTTGEITQYNSGGNVYGYVNQYVNLRYANNASGTSGFSTLPTNSTYFGVFNSSTPTPSSNPAAYIWREVAGGFGTTKTIYYSAIGGRQVLWAAASSPPSSNYVVSVANVAIDLDVVTTASGAPGERGPIAMAYVITTADPTTATSSQLTAWFEAARDNVSPPIGTGLTPVPGDTAYFTYPTTASSATFTYNGSVWNSAVGQVVSGDTLVANTVSGSKIANSAISNDKILNSTITGDKISFNTITGNLIVANTITGNLIAANTITGDKITANTITGNLIAANTISANSLQANSITATQISSAYIYAGNIVSQTATLGNTSSTGYWLRYTDGAARFGGNVNIGNNLTIGSNAQIGGNVNIGVNAQIGGNLAVTGLITAGALNSNTVSTLTITPASVSVGVGSSRSSNVTIGTQVNNSYPTLGYSVTNPITINVTTANTAVYIFGGASLYATWTGGNPSQYFQYRLFRQDQSTMLWTQIYTQNSPTYAPAVAFDNSSIAYYDTGVTPGSYVYVWTVYAVSTGSSTRTTTLSTNYNTIFAQELKR